MNYMPVFKKNEGILGIETPCYKARLFAKDFTQRKKINFNEVFSPVVKHSSIRLLLTMVALYDLELEKLDLKEGADIQESAQGNRHSMYGKPSLFAQQVLVWLESISQALA